MMNLYASQHAVFSFFFDSEIATKKYDSSFILKALGSRMEQNVIVFSFTSYPYGCCWCWDLFGTKILRRY